MESRGCSMGYLIPGKARVARGPDSCYLGLFGKTVKKGKSLKGCQDCLIPFVCLLGIGDGGQVGLFLVRGGGMPLPCELVGACRWL